MVNYTSNSTVFWNQLFITSLRDIKVNIVNFISILIIVHSPPKDNLDYRKALVNDYNNIIIEICTTIFYLMYNSKWFIKEIIIFFNLSKIYYTSD